MKRPGQTLPDDEMPRPGESFLARFHRRKLEARQENVPAPVDDEPIPEADVVEEPPTDADMPPLDTLDAESDYTGFLSPKVTEKLRRAALRKLFHSAEFNVVDGLDEYAEDFTTFDPLGDIITADMRHQLEVEARKKAEAIERELSEGASERTEPGVDDDEQTESASAVADEANPNPTDESTDKREHDEITPPTNA